MNQILESKQTPNIWSSRASYGVHIVRIWEKIDRVIAAPHCTFVVAINTHVAQRDNVVHVNAREIHLFVLLEKHSPRTENGSHLDLISAPPLITRFMGPTWGPPRADRTQVGPMLTPWTLGSPYLRDGQETLSCKYNAVHYNKSYEAPFINTDLLNHLRD